jgi:SAM-dependent methyltransferase
MHLSALTCMDDCIQRYMTKDREYNVLDFGSWVNRGQSSTHRLLLKGYNTHITGVDIESGRNVDIQMTKPYKIPVKSASQDIVMSGQVFEHIPFMWASMLEIARVLKPGGLFFITVPSRGHRHYTYDLWRFYPDSMRAFAVFAELELVEVHTDWPPRTERIRHDYAAIETRFHYWGDTTAVFRKPKWRLSLWRVIHREVVLRHANQLADLQGAPLPKRHRIGQRDREGMQRDLRRRLRRRERRRLRRRAERRAQRRARAEKQGENAG